MWNNFDYTDQGYFCTFLHFEGGIGGGGLDGDFSNLLSNVTLNGQPLDTENVSFVCARWIGWENGIILRFKTLPQENSILVFPAGTTFTVGGEDANVYEISETMELKMKNACDLALSRSEGALERLNTALNVLNPHRVLERGYAFVTDSNEKVVTNSAREAGEKLKLHFADGILPVTVDSRN